MDACVYKTTLLSSILLLGGCGAMPNQSSDLEAIPHEPLIATSEVNAWTSVSEEEFCQNNDPSACFTLVVQVPDESLEQQLGLNTLSLAAKAEQFRVPLLRSCHSGLKAYAKGHSNRSLTLRNQLFKGIKETRCTFAFIKRESFNVPDLAQGQIGLALRLNDWNINGEVTTKDYGFFNVSLRGASLATSYRDAKVFAKPVDQDKSQWSDLLSNDWRPFGGYTPLTTQSFQLNFGGDMDIHFSGSATFEKLLEIIEDAKDIPLDDPTVQGYIQNVGKHLARLADQPFDASLALVGIGVDAILSLCQPECGKIDQQTIQAVNKLKEAVGNAGAVDSHASAIFSDSFKMLPAKLVDDAFWHANGNELRKSLGIEPPSPDPYDDQYFD